MCLKTALHYVGTLKVWATIPGLGVYLVNIFPPPCFLIPDILAVISMPMAAVVYIRDIPRSAPAMGMGMGATVPSTPAATKS